jgi:hypothetical protein
MVTPDLDLFRQDLAGLMQALARDRRRACAGAAACGQDLKIIALFEKLARDAETCDAGVFHACQNRLDREPLARCFQRRTDLLAEIGTLFWPKSIGELVGWMTDQVTAGPAPRQGRDPFDNLTAVHSALASPTPRPSFGDTAQREAPAAWAVEFTAAFGIVAPVLGVWEIGVAVGQQHDRAAMSAHPAVPARVVSADSVPDGRGASTTDVVLAFRPSPSAGDCRIMMRAVSPPLAVQPGQSLMVVPRSFDCEAPLIQSRIGDPLPTILLAAALLAGGVACLGVWSRWRLPRTQRLGLPALP